MVGRPQKLGPQRCSACPLGSLGEIPAWAHREHPEPVGQALPVSGPLSQLGPSVNNTACPPAGLLSGRTLNRLKMCLSPDWRGSVG